MASTEYMFFPLQPSALLCWTARNLLPERSEICSGLSQHQVASVMGLWVVVLYIYLFINLLIYFIYVGKPTFSILARWHLNKHINTTKQTFSTLLIVEEKNVQQRKPNPQPLCLIVTRQNIVAVGSFHVKWSNVPHLATPDFDEIR